jgi:DNA-binding GntR family transcriptional regulator
MTVTRPAVKAEGTGRRKDAGGIMYEELIRVQGRAAAIVCAGVTARQLTVLQDCVQFAAGLPAGTEWDRRVAAHGQVFALLAAAAGDSVVAAILGSGAEYLRDLAIGAGPGAAGMLASSHRRLLAHLGAGDAEASAAEIEGLFRALHMRHRDERVAGHASHQYGATDPGRHRSVGDAVA